jgi:hypothetical protein
VNQNSPSSQWTLPPGPGIHFAHVLVKNGKGGCTEGRIAVNTDLLPRSQAAVPRDQYPVAQPHLSQKDLDTGLGSVPNETKIEDQLLLGDGSVCGKRIPFFGVDVTARVQLRDSTGTMVLSQTNLNPYALAYSR